MDGEGKPDDKHKEHQQPSDSVDKQLQWEEAQKDISMLIVQDAQADAAIKFAQDKEKTKTNYHWWNNTSNENGSGSVSWILVNVLRSNCLDL